MKHYKYSIAFYINGMPFDGSTLEKRDLGGSETIGLQMARTLKQQGHEVIVFSNCEQQGVYDGVQYLNVAQFPDWAIFTPHDITICQRDPQIFSLRINSKLHILWSHDLALNRFSPLIRGTLWNVDQIWVLSEFMKSQYKQVYKLPDEAFKVTRNGIDRYLLPAPLPLEQRDKNKVIYTARPERGMDIVLEKTFPRLLEKLPDLKLYLAGYNNRVPQLAGLYNKIDQLIAGLGDKCIYLGALTKKDLYEHYRTSMLYLYPSDFEEISCITAMECMAVGLPMIGQFRAALPETLGNQAGKLIWEEEASSSEFQDKFISEALELLTDNDKWKENSEAGYERSKSFGLESLGQEWSTLFDEFFENATKDKVRLAYHFTRRSDIIAAKTSLEKTNDTRKGKLSKRLRNQWPFVFDYKYTENEEIAAKKYLAEVGDVLWLPNAPRWPTVKRWLEGHPEVKNILDIGCAQGEYIGAILELDEKYHVDGFDISPSMVRSAGKVLQEKYPDNSRWSVALADENVKPAPKYDLVFLMEVLEHVPEPWKLADAAEKWLKPGGTIIVTTPIGTWEMFTYRRESKREHIWELENRDIKEMFNHKPNFQKMIIPAYVSELDGVARGWYFYTWQEGGEPAKPINMERKLYVQNPRQTVSVCMIIKNGEDMLRRCLKSVDWIADEIIVADDSSTDNTREISKEYADFIIEGMSPQKVGFDEARNNSIKSAQMDWILWIDADEELLRVSNLDKYLRENIFKGYAIRQHHFSTNPPNAFLPDLPVRLFRNNKGIKFYGVVHEHPEIGLNKSVGEITLLGDVEIAHDGYFTEEGRIKRFHRNFDLMIRDREKYPDRVLGKFLMVRDWAHLARYKLQANRGLMTDEIVGICHNAIDLYRKEFLNNGCNIRWMIDGLPYYSEAIGFLGLGIKAKIAIDIKPDDPDPANNFLEARFLNAEDIKAFMNILINDMSSPWMGKYV